VSGINVDKLLQLDDDETIGPDVDMPVSKQEYTQRV